MRTLRATLLTIIGILSIIFGIVCFNMDEGRYEMSSSYGGDAYTGIQNASANTANNVQVLTKNVNKGMGFMLLIAGMSLIAVGVTASGTEKQEEKKNEPTQTSENTPESQQVSPEPEDNDNENTNQ